MGYIHGCISIHTSNSFLFIFVVRHLSIFPNWLLLFGVTWLRHDVQHKHQSTVTIVAETYLFAFLAVCPCQTKTARLKWKACWIPDGISNEQSVVPTGYIDPICNCSKGKIIEIGTALIFRSLYIFLEPIAPQLPIYQATRPLVPNIWVFPKIGVLPNHPF